MYRYRALSGFLVVALAAGVCLPQAAFAYGKPLPDAAFANGGLAEEGPATEGVCGRGAVWSYDVQTRTLSIALAEGETSGLIDAVGWAPWSSDIDDVVVQEGITQVGTGVFAGQSLKTVSLASTVESIGDAAFSSCESLSQVKGALGVTRIGAGAFSGCVALSEISLPAGLSKIGRNAFRDCLCAFSGGLSIPASVTEVADGAFSGCNAVSLVEFAGDAPAIAGTAFSDIVAKAVYPQLNATWTKSAKRNYGGELAWYARMSDGSLLPEKFNTGYTDVSLREGVFQTERFDDAALGYSFSIVVAKTGPVHFDFSWSLPCTHNYFNIAVIDSSGDTVMQADVYQSFAESDCAMARSETLAAGTYRVAVTYRVGHSGQAASFSARYTTDSPYADVLSDAWYYDAVCRASTDGLMTGYDNGLFGPADSLTRAQAATILWRYFEPTAAGSYVKDGATNRTGMSDVADGAFYTEAANWAVQQGVVHGVEKDGELVFDPDALIPRSQLCVMIANAARSLRGAQVEAATTEAFDAMPDAGDVPGWAISSIAWCVNEGVVNGVDEGGVRYVRPDAVVDRATMAQMMENAIASGAFAQ